MAAPHNDNIREKILAAASELLKTRTFDQVSLSDIAKEAGVTKGSVYYYYKTKNEILYEIADSYLAILYSDLKSWIEDTGKDTSLPRLVKYALQRGEHDPGKGLRLHLTLEAVNGDEKIRQQLLDRYTLFRKELGRLVVQRLLRKNLPPEEAEKKEYFYGWLLVLLVDGMMLQNLMQNDELDEIAITEELVKLLIE